MTIFTTEQIAAIRKIHLETIRARETLEAIVDALAEADPDDYADTDEWCYLEDCKATAETFETDLDTLASLLPAVQS